MNVHWWSFGVRCKHRRLGYPNEEIQARAEQQNNWCCGIHAAPSYSAQMGLSSTSHSWSLRTARKSPPRFASLSRCLRGSRRTLTPVAICCSNVRALVSQKDNDVRFLQSERVMRDTARELARLSVCWGGWRRGGGRGGGGGGGGARGPPPPYICWKFIVSVKSEASEGGVGLNGPKKSLSTECTHARLTQRQ
jgi:hypothetical protein